MEELSEKLNRYFPGKVVRKDLSKKIKEEFNAVAVEMEGASIGMTSYLSGIPFLVIRSISDVIGKDNLITYDKFLKKSSTEVAEFTLEIINNL